MVRNRGRGAPQVKDEHLILLGQMNGKLDMLVARAAADETRLQDASNAAWWGKSALLLTIVSFYPKARELIGPLMGL